MLGSGGGIKVGAAEKAPRVSSVPAGAPPVFVCAGRLPGNASGKTAIRIEIEFRKSEGIRALPGKFFH
jgi:hypothetical protein